MIMGLKESIHYIVQAIPEVKFSREWLADKMSNCIDNLTSTEFCVRGIVADNHASKCMHFLHSLKSSLPIHINTSTTQEILTRKHSCLMMRYIS